MTASRPKKVGTCNDRGAATAARHKTNKLNNHDRLNLKIYSLVASWYCFRDRHIRMGSTLRNRRILRVVDDEVPCFVHSGRTLKVTIAVGFQQQRSSPLLERQSGESGNEVGQDGIGLYSSDSLGDCPAAGLFGRVAFGED
jgi:hypothetical protein